eukprot:COSAG01_NODE_2889_length_6907_cov_43.104877_7_plen_193_part_00
MFLEGSGYAKLGDFGFAKVLRRDATQGAAGRTFTHCGTPEYVSPEMLANTGHNHGADWWALGIFIYETLQGTTPFSAKDYSGTFKQIVRYCGDPHLPWVRGRPVSREARALIRALLEPDQASRLGNASSSADTLGAGAHRHARPFDPIARGGGLENTWHTQCRESRRLCLLIMSAPPPTHTHTLFLLRHTCR